MELVVVRDIGYTASEVGLVLLFICTAVMCVSLAFHMHYSKKAAPVLKALVFLFCSLTALAYIFRDYLAENEFTQCITFFSGIWAFVPACYTVLYALRLYEQTLGEDNERRFRKLLHE